MIGRNNPLNIRYSPLNSWKGSRGKTRGFVNFSELKYGVRAAAYLLMVSYKQKKVLTVSDIIHRFAPPSENFTKNYIKFVCDCSGLYPVSIPCNYLEFSRLIHSMWKFEQGKEPSMSVADIANVLSEFNLPLL